ncbi:uncharacterized protein LOC142337404 [Convolutriloba macropyga]|uniref:uncharacterized protein LOC142337404 n=1 Tax=Convolutriloba macropyga TaxID=536237 RepID=UPI003F521E27
MTCSRPSLHSHISLQPSLVSYPAGSKVTFDCKPPSQVGSSVPLKFFGSTYAKCNGSNSQWVFEIPNHEPHCENDVGNFENKVQIVVTVFACTLMACLVFLMFTFGFKAYNYRREYKTMRAGKPPSYRDVMMNPHSYPPSSNESLTLSSSTITVFSTEPPSPIKPSIRHAASTTTRYSSTICSATTPASAKTPQRQQPHAAPRRIKTVSFSDDILFEVDSRKEAEQIGTSDEKPPPYSEVRQESSVVGTVLSEGEETDL